MSLGWQSLRHVLPALKLQYGGRFTGFSPSFSFVRFSPSWKASDYADFQKPEA